MPGMRRLGVASAALLIAGCTVVSRVTGLARDVLLAQYYGLSWVADAWNFAFQIPNLFRRLLGEGALAAAFVPTLTRVLTADGPGGAQRLFSGALGLLTVALAGAVLLGELVILAIWHLAPAEPASSAARNLVLALTAIMLPFMLGVCVLALLASTLNALQRFAAAALAPIILNLFMIVGIVWIGPTLFGGEPETQVFGVALSVIAASVAQLVFLGSFVRGAGLRLAWRWTPSDVAVRGMLALLGPVIVGQGVLTLGVFLDAQLCLLLTRTVDAPATVNWFGVTFDYPLREGALSALTYAARLYQFPLGVLAVSLSTAALPTLSRLASDRTLDGWRDTFSGALRAALFVALPAGGSLIVFAEPMVRLLFEYRSFTADDTLRAASVLRWYGLALPAFFAQHLVLRGFYSLQDVRTPLVLSVCILPVNLGLSLVLIWQPELREAGFAVSAALTSTLGLGIGLILLARRSGSRIVDWRLGVAAARMVLLSGVSLAAAWGVYVVLRDFSSSDTFVAFERAMQLLPALLTCGLVYGGASWLSGAKDVWRLLHWR